MWAASKQTVTVDSVVFPRTEMHVKLHKQITVDGGQQGVTIKSKSILTPAWYTPTSRHSLAKGTRRTHIDLERIHHVQNLWDVRSHGGTNEVLRSLGIHVQSSAVWDTGTDVSE